MNAPTHLLAQIRAQIIARIAAALAERGVGEEVQLTPPANADFGDLALPCHRFAKALRKAPQSIASELVPVVKEVDVVAPGHHALGRDVMRRTHLCNSGGGML